MRHTEAKELAEMAIACAREAGTVTAWIEAKHECEAARDYFVQQELYTMAERWQRAADGCRERARWTNGPEVQHDTST